MLWQRDASVCRVAAISILMVAQCRTDLRWWDGTVDPVDEPAGQLLSENSGYWGEQILTGVTYTYKPPPDNPRDHWREMTQAGMSWLEPGAER